MAPAGASRVSVTAGPPPSRSSRIRTGSERSADQRRPSAPTITARTWTGVSSATLGAASSAARAGAVATASTDGSPSKPSSIEATWAGLAATATTRSGAPSSTSAGTRKVTAGAPAGSSVTTRCAEVVVPAMSVTRSSTVALAPTAGRSTVAGSTEAEVLTSRPSRRSSAV